LIDKDAFSSVPVLVPYSRFLESQDRRRKIAAELTRRTMLDDVVVPTRDEVAIVRAGVDEGVVPDGGVGGM
jgi:hypothetical protein